MLKALFPAAVAEIAQRAAEERNAALWSGKAGASGSGAGLTLGKAVAAVLVARGSADGLKNAVGNAAQWQGPAHRAPARAENPLIHQEAPPPAPLVPKFCLLQAGVVTSARGTPARPPAPPSTP